MIRPCTAGFFIDRGRHAPRLGPFLQHGLCVPGILIDRGDPPAPKPQDQRPGRLQPGVLIDGGDHRFHGVAQQRLFPASTGQHFRPAKFQHIAQPDVARDIGAGFLADQGIEAGGQLTLAGPGVAGHQRFGHHQTQHPVAQKLQPLIVGPGRGADRRVRHRPHQQVWRAERVSETALKGQKLGRQPHSTALK